MKRWLNCDLFGAVLLLADIAYMYLLQPVDTLTQDKPQRIYALVTFLLFTELESLSLRLIPRKAFVLSLDLKEYNV